jgi:hypothetical protein
MRSEVKVCLRLIWLRKRSTFEGVIFFVQRGGIVAQHNPAGKSR